MATEAAGEGINLQFCWFLINYDIPWNPVRLEMEYTAADEADEQRFKKVIDRLGKAIMMSAEAETSEIIRRRLFEWTANAVTPEGKIMLPKDAVTTCNEYADWVIEHK